MLHFFDVSRRVKIVCIKKGPAKARCDQLANSGLPCSSCAHNQDEHDASALGSATKNIKRCEGRAEKSPAERPAAPARPPCQGRGSRRSRRVDLATSKHAETSAKRWSSQG